MGGPECGLSWSRKPRPPSVAHITRLDSLSWGFAPTLPVLGASLAVAEWLWFDPNIRQLFLVGGPFGKLLFGVSRGV